MGHSLAVTSDWAYVSGGCSENTVRNYGWTDLGICSFAPLDNAGMDGPNTCPGISRQRLHVRTFLIGSPAWWRIGYLLSLRAAIRHGRLCRWARKLWFMVLRESPYSPFPSHRLWKGQAERKRKRYSQMRTEPSKSCTVMAPFVFGFCDFDTSNSFGEVSDVYIPPLSIDEENNDDVPATATVRMIAINTCGCRWIILLTWKTYPHVVVVLSTWWRAIAAQIINLDTNWAYQDIQWGHSVIIFGKLSRGLREILLRSSGVWNFWPWLPCEILWSPEDINPKILSWIPAIWLYCWMSFGTEITKT